MIAYPVPGKQKAIDICKAFIEGAGEAGRRSRAAVFYGVTDKNRASWMQARREGRDWYYIDNSYFDATRGTHYRITKNRLQHDGSGTAPHAGRIALGLKCKPWVDEGKHVLLCPQSDSFMHDVAGQKGNWTEQTLALLRQYTQRELRVREWSPDKRAIGRSLIDDLQDCWALVTWSSAAAVTALIEGVPVFVGTTDCAAWPLAGWGLRHIENPRKPAFRAEWANVLAHHQWTIDEMRSGWAWKSLNG